MPETPVNFTEIRESFELAMEHHDEIPDNVADDIIATVEEACANNEDDLMWESDFEEFTDILDGLLDSVYGNGYDEQVNQLDDIRGKLESADD